MGATFGNTVMLGFPLVISAFGPEAAAPMTLLITIETPLLWAMATVHMSLAAHDGGARVRSVLADILLEVVKSPIVMSLLLGALGRAVGLTLPPIADRIFALLSQAAVPTALFAVGMTLAVNGVRGQVPTLSVICALKLLVYPAFVWALAVHVFALPPLWVSIAVLLAGMPVGVVAFLFATRYERAVEPVSAAVSVSTAIAVLTVSALLYGLGTGAR
jgi:predicted permease